MEWNLDNRNTGTPPGNKGVGTGSNGKGVIDGKNGGVTPGIDPTGQYAVGFPINPVGKAVAETLGGTKPSERPRGRWF